MTATHEIDAALTKLAGVLAMAARYAEGRGTFVLADVRAAYSAWAALQTDPNPRPPHCNEDDHAVLLGRFDSRWDALNARLNR